MVAESVVSQLLDGSSYSCDFRLLKRVSLPNETVSQFEVSVLNSETVQTLRFNVWVSEFEDSVLGYKIYDYLGNVLSNLNDATLQPYFYVHDHRQYMADLGRVAIRFGRSRWF